MPHPSAEQRTRLVIKRCADCGHCRDLMDETFCLFMPELYRLIDREMAGGAPISSVEMKQLLGLCNTCGICPCVPVHTGIQQARDAFIKRDGLPATVSLLENVQLFGRIGSAMPRLVNAVTGDSLLAQGIKRVIGIHPERKLPRFAQDGFSAWAKQRGLMNQPQTTGRKVAYFAGCSARYYFPEVAKATVEVLEHNQVAVYLPEQQCCGAPAMQEGDRGFTFKRMGFNLAELSRCVAAGFDIVCSCPTCGYLLKSVLREGAQYAEDYRARVEQMADQEQNDAAFTGRAAGHSAHGIASWTRFSDQGYFAEISGLERLRVANHCYDLGEYLHTLHQAGQLKLGFGPVSARVGYFAPCHQRQQGIGQPWLDLLHLLPEIRLEPIGDSFDCCGQGGIMGFKKDYHQTALHIGAGLIAKIKTAQPQRIATDCLSCRLQFQQLLPFNVAHPVEILWEGYQRAGNAP